MPKRKQLNQFLLNFIRLAVGNLSASNEVHFLLELKVILSILQTLIIERY